MSAEKLIAALAVHGCEPRQISPGLWVAACPACSENGHFGLLEINTTEGTTIRCATETI